MQVSLAAGGRHSLLIFDDGTAQCFGCDEQGRSTVPDLAGRKAPRGLVKAHEDCEGDA